MARFIKSRFAFRTSLLMLLIVSVCILSDAKKPPQPKLWTLEIKPAANIRTMYQVSAFYDPRIDLGTDGILVYTGPDVDIRKKTDEYASAGFRVVAMTNRTGVHIVCFDVLKGTVEFIREGFIDVTIGQRHYNIGHRAVEAFVQIHQNGMAHAVHGAYAGGIIDTGIDIVTRDSRDRYNLFLQRTGLPVRF